jgi:hypothetical protein
MEFEKRTGLQFPLNSFSAFSFARLPRIFPSVLLSIILPKPSEQVKKPLPGAPEAPREADVENGVTDFGCYRTT